MKTKELLEARWKFIIFAFLAVLLASANSAVYTVAKSMTATGLPDIAGLQEKVQATFISFDAYVWGNWFGNNAGTLFSLLAVILGAGLIAGEVSKGTIFFLLSKPIGRERIILTKYGISAAILLGAILCGSVALFISSLVMDHPQDVLRLLNASILLWFGLLFVLGLALVFSVIFQDVIRPLVFTLLITILLGIPALLPATQIWGLPYYWTSRDAYLNGSFPVTAYLVDLVAAVVPLVFSLVLFRRKAY